MSSIISKETIIRIKGHFQEKYGTEMDEWTAVILTELNDNFNQFGLKVEKSILDIDKATNQIKGQIKSVHFSSNKQAFWYAFGQYLIPSIIFLIGIATTAYFVSQSEKYDTISRFVSEYPNFDAFRDIIREGELREIDKTKYLILRPAKKSNAIMVGKEYKYLSNENIVIVPLQTDNQ